jgi:plastocyanin
VEIGSGGKVTWTNNSGSTVTISSQNPNFTSPNILNGQTFERTYRVGAGEYGYTCKFIGQANGISGVVEVVDP